MKSISVTYLFFLLVVFSFPVKIFSQECVVDKESLKGAYTGDCKKGKANGKGKAVGTDTYEGDFKSGLPEGHGVYTWHNGTNFTGHFSKGLREGAGVLTFKRENAPDSVVEGFWKNDRYIGKYEKPYTIFFQSKSMATPEIEYKKDKFSQVTFYVTNTSGGSSTLSGNLPRFQVDEVIVISGRYGRMIRNDDNHVKKTETILTDMTYPIRMKLIIEKEELEIEFREAGSYVVNITINQ